MTDFFLFGIFPYMAFIVAVVVAIWRYVRDPFTYSSLSSQFLEGRQLFWGSVPWHYGIVIVLAGHLIGAVFPSGVQVFNSVPLRLYILEATALMLGLLATWGLALLIVRRLTNPRVRSVTTYMDIALLVALLSAVISGVGTAIFFRWGSSWFVHTATPYLWSLVTLSPKWQYLADMPWVVKLHVVNAFVLTALFPFTRLVHIVSFPVTYLWRPYQVVAWSRRLLPR